MKDLRGLGGMAATVQEVRDVENRLGLRLPDQLVEVLTQAPLGGLTFTLSEDEDPSGLGVDMRWMTPKQIVEEGTETYPGISAVSADYLPIGIDLTGGGDPYFVRLDDLALVRIPHDAIRGDALVMEAVELVALSLDAFIDHATAGR
ncbi:MAG: SMI1/KNR4 family protein [Myxococcota bacterium]